MSPEGAVVLTRSNVAELLRLDECIDAVERVFKLHGEGRTQAPGILGVHAHKGGFHIKAGIMDLNRSYFVAKTNANFPNNHKLGLPTIQGLVLVCDAVNGSLLAVMDSIEITILRTGAATAVAAKYLAREGSRSALICGCGNQGYVSAKAISNVRELDRLFVYDIEPARAELLADKLSKELEIETTLTHDLEMAAPESDIIVTCTTAKEYFLKSGYVAPGSFVAAVGADSEEKQELEPALLAKARIVTDITDQCVAIGELHHAIEVGSVSLDDVHAQLGEVVSEKKPGRTNDDEIIVFDSTGMALQDVAAAAIVYERAIEAGDITKINFNDQDGSAQAEVSVLELS